MSLASRTILAALADGLSHEEQTKGKRFILLAGYNMRYEAFVGTGGIGLVSIEKLEAVKKLLKPPK